MPIQQPICKNCGNAQAWALKCTKCGQWICVRCILEHDPKKKRRCPSCDKKGFRKYKIKVEEKEIDHHYLDLDEKRMYLKKE